MLIFRNKSSSYYFYLLKSTCKYPGLIKKQVFFAHESLPGIKYSDKNLHKLGVSKHASNFLRSIRSWNCKLSIWSLVEILRKSQSLGQNFKNWIWSCFGRIIPDIIEFIFLEYLIPKRMFDIFSIVFQVFQESTFKNSK